MSRCNGGFTLIELIAVMVILGIIGITATASFSDSEPASVQASRDDLVAALFFAQQKAMAQSDIALEVSSGSVNVTRSGSAFSVHQDAYPQAFAGGVSASSAHNFSYNKLGEITNLTGPVQITLQKGGTSATVTVEPSGYAY